MRLVEEEGVDLGSSGLGLTREEEGDEDEASRRHGAARA